LRLQKTEIQEEITADGHPDARREITRTVPALNSVSSFTITVSPMNVITLGSLFLNMQVVLSTVALVVSTGFAET